MRMQGANMVCRACMRSLATRVPAGQTNGTFFGQTWENLGYEVSKINGAPKIHSPWNKWFPYEPVPFSPRLGPYKEKVVAGQTYHMCTCGESVSQPYCDEVGCKDTPFKPTVFIPEYTTSV